MTTLQSTDTGASLFDWLARQDRRARGATFSEVLDKARLGKQALAVARVMQDQAWHTFDDLSKAGVPGMQTAISARIRELRQFLEQTGRGTIERERVTAGLWHYRMILRR